MRHSSPNELDRNESIGSSTFDSTIRTWGWEEIRQWTEEIFDEKLCEEVQKAFEEHDVKKGCVLLNLEEHHLKEIGFKKVGSRLMLLEAIVDLRKQAGIVDSRKYTDIESLIEQ